MRCADGGFKACQPRWRAAQKGATSFGLEDAAAADGGAAIVLAASTCCCREECCGRFGRCCELFWALGRSFPDSRAPVALKQAVRS